jgi:hypothetical protein
MTLTDGDLEVQTVVSVRACIWAKQHSLLCFTFSLPAAFIEQDQLYRESLI